MTSNIEYLEIIGLYGQRDYLVKFENNQLILVGENGTGKSTITSIFYFVITGQWKKLWKFDFEKVSISVDLNVYEITKDDVSQLIDVEQPVFFKVVDTLYLNFMLHFLPFYRVHYLD